MRTPSAGIADVIRAYTALQPGGLALKAMVEMFGLGYTPDPTELTSIPKVSNEDSDDEQLEQPIQDSDLNINSPIDSLPSSIRRLQPVRQSVAGKGTTVTDPLADSSTVQLSTRPLFRGLLSDRDITEMLQSAVSVPTPTEKIHAERAVRELARARPLTTLPRVHVGSMALGAHVLIDVGQPMRPFGEDQEDLVRRLKRILSQSVEILYFANDPILGAGTGRRKFEWQPWTPPPAEKPVIVLSDLGCGHPRRKGTTEALYELALWLRRRRSRLVIFAPVSGTRIPNNIQQLAEIVLWDDSSGRRSAARLRRAVDV